MDYYSKEGIAEAIKTLEGFDELRRLRRIAHYENNENLDEFVVLGRWLFDTCGNCMGAEKPFNVDPVLTKTEFFEAIGRDKRVGFGIPTSIPGDRDICPFCNRGWSIRNIHDCYRVSISRAWFTYHTRCYQIKLATETQSEFKGALVAAGFGPVLLIPIPNEYYPDTIFYTYWFDVYTSLARFKIGWRKRVIHLELVDPPEGYNFNELFEKENVTKGEQMIHCYGYRKMVEYLDKLRGELVERRRVRLYMDPVESAV